MISMINYRISLNNGTHAMSEWEEEYKYIYINVWKIRIAQERYMWVQVWCWGGGDKKIGLLWLGRTALWRPHSPPLLLGDLNAMPADANNIIYRDVTARRRRCALDTTPHPKRAKTSMRVHPAFDVRWIRHVIDRSTVHLPKETRTCL